MSDKQKLWEQQEGESNDAYARFLIYRNLGPARSLDAAYALGAPKATKGNKSRGSGKVAKRASGQWTKDCALFEWSERASAWDIEQLEQQGRSTVVSFVNALNVVAVKLLEEIQRTKRKPKSWKEIVSTLNVLGNFIPPETVAAIRDHAREHRISPIGGSGSNPSESVSG